MGKEIAAAYDAIRKVKNLAVTLTPMSTQVESNNLDDIFQAIRTAHTSAKSAGAKRIISTIRITLLNHRVYASDIGHGILCHHPKIEQSQEF
jgi:uncharacterized protein YqgV (UPF0045/DUF77 family)